MDDSERNEINRLWTDLRVTQMLVSHVVAAMITAEQIDRWHAERHAHFDGREDWSDGYRVNMSRALDEMASLLRISRARRDGDLAPD